MKRYPKKILSLIISVVVFASLVSGCKAKTPAENAVYPDSTQITESTQQAESTPVPENTPQTESAEDEDLVYYGDDYTAPLDVAAYIYEWEELPPNFITKNEAKELGWDSSKGNLWDVAYGMSIGGDRFGNREGLLPEGEEYRECDVNYTGGYRGAERLVYSIDDYDIYYTADHYESFEQVYSYEEGYVWE